MIEMLMTKKDVAKHFGKSEKTIERWVSKGSLPPPLKLKGNDKKNAFWTLEAIEKWITSDYTKQVDRLLKHGTV